MVFTRGKVISESNIHKSGITEKWYSQGERLSQKAAFTEVIFTRKGTGKLK
jgi:hypothetical protein